MTICLYGEDSYLRLRKLKEIETAYRKKNGLLDLEVFDLEEESPARLGDFLGQTSMFTDSKAAFIKNISAVADEEEKELIRLLKKYSAEPRIFLIITDTKKPKRAYQFLFREEYQEFIFPRGREMEKFLSAEAVRRELRLTEGARRELVKRLESDSEPTWRAVNLLDQWQTVFRGQPVSTEAAIDWLDFRAKKNIFFTVGGIMNGETLTKRLAALETLLLQKEEPAHLFNLLAYQGRGERAECLAEHDILIKSGKMDYEEALLSLAIGHKKSA